MAQNNHLLRKLHLWWGGIGLVLFLLSGQYMARVLEVGDMADLQRMKYRSAHIYLLLVWGLNVVAGYYMGERHLTRLERLMSLVLLGAPLALGATFILESGTAEVDRPYTLLFLLMTFLVLAQMISSSLFRWWRDKRAQEQSP